MALAHLLLVALAPIAAGDGDWFHLFDGKSLAHFRGDERFWSVTGGAITGASTPDVPCTSTARPLSQTWTKSQHSHDISE